MAGEVKISVIATGFDASRPLKRIEQPIHRRQVEPRAVSGRQLQCGPVALPRRTRRKTRSTTPTT